MAKTLAGSIAEQYNLNKPVGLYIAWMPELIKIFVPPGEGNVFKVQHNSGRISKMRITGFPFGCKFRVMMSGVIIGEFCGPSSEIDFAADLREFVRDTMQLIARRGAHRELSPYVLPHLRVLLFSLINDCRTLDDPNFNPLWTLPEHAGLDFSRVENLTISCECKHMLPAIKIILELTRWDPKLNNLLT